MKKTLLVAVLGLILTMGIVSLINAQQTNDSKNFEKSNFFPGRNEDIKKAIENNDYATWKNLMGDKSITEKINESNFAKFVEMHTMIQNNDSDGAKKIAEELGINSRMRNGFKMKGQGQGKGCGCANDDATKQCGCSESGTCGQFIDENKDGQCDKRNNIK